MCHADRNHTFTVGQGTSGGGGAAGAAGGGSGSGGLPRAADNRHDPAADRDAAREPRGRHREAADGAAPAARARRPVSLVLASRGAAGRPAPRRRSPVPSRQSGAVRRRLRAPGMATAAGHGRSVRAGTCAGALGDAAASGDVPAVRALSGCRARGTRSPTGRRRVSTLASAYGPTRRTGGRATRRSSPEVAASLGLPSDEREQVGHLLRRDQPCRDQGASCSAAIRRSSRSRRAESRCPARRPAAA